MIYDDTDPLVPNDEWKEPASLIDNKGDLTCTGGVDTIMWGNTEYWKCE